MKSPRNLPYYIVIIQFLFSFSNLIAQSNTLTGMVELIPKSEKIRISRGNSYRNRTKSGITSNELQKTTDHYSQIIVSLKPLSFTPQIVALHPIKIFQKNKTFTPNLVPLTKGTIVQFVNQDEFYHNVFSLTPKSRFNIGRRPSGAINDVKIKKQGIINVFCDIHSHMKATIISLETPYFATLSESGKFTINGLPDGKYQIEVYNLDNKILFQTIDLKNGEVLKRDLLLDENRTAYIETSSSRLIANVTCCETGNLCNKISP